MTDGDAKNDNTLIIHSGTVRAMRLLASDKRQPLFDHLVRPLQERWRDC